MKGGRGEHDRTVTRTQCRTFVSDKSVIINSTSCHIKGLIRKKD